MTREDFFRKELVTELRRIETLMRREENFEKKNYYYSAAYGITSRTFRYSFSEDYLIADLVLNTTFNMINERFKRIRSGDNSVTLELRHFEHIQDGLKGLADAIENGESVLSSLEMILKSAYSTTGPGNYLREKGSIKL